MTKIEWTDETWNPIVGCRKVSPGCAHCYAETMAKRLAAMGKENYSEVITERGLWNGHVKCLPERLEIPLKWKKTRMIFVNSMSDLFHDDVPFEFIKTVFAVMGEAKQHTFQILTKRANRMHEYITRRGRPCVLPNVWLGVSAENQDTFYARYPFLAQTPAAVRFISIEPMLGPIDIGSAMPDWVICGSESGPHAMPSFRQAMGEGC